MSCCVEDVTRTPTPDSLEVGPIEADSAELSDAITAAGYSPAPAELRKALTPASRLGGCCCCSGGS